MLPRVQRAWQHLTPSRVLDRPDTYTHKGKMILNKKNFKFLSAGCSLLRAEDANVKV
jgi:hypothetical protein